MDTINKFQLGQTVYFADAGAVNECTVKEIDLDDKGTVNYLLKGGAYERYATENRLSCTAREALIKYYTFHKNKLSEKLEQTKKELEEVEAKLVELQ